MTTYIEYDFNDIETEILSKFINYADGLIDQLIKQGATTPWLAYKSYLSSIYMKLNYLGIKDFGLKDGEQMTLRWLYELFFCESFSFKYLTIPGWPDNLKQETNLILSKYSESDLKGLQQKINSGKRSIGSCFG